MYNSYCSCFFSSTLIGWDWDSGWKIGSYLEGDERALFDDFIGDGGVSNSEFKESKLAEVSLSFFKTFSIY